MYYFLCIFFLRATDASSFHSYGSSASNYNLFHAAHTLLMVVYRRDCRRPFAPKDHWLVKDVKSSLLVAELERGRQSVQVERSDVCVFPVRTNNSSPFCFATLSLSLQLLLQKMPHVIPLEDRVLLFRKYISNEKNALGLTETASASPQSILITVHRFFPFFLRAFITICKRLDAIDLSRVFFLTDEGCVWWRTLSGSWQICRCNYGKASFESNLLIYKV